VSQWSTCPRWWPSDEKISVHVLGVPSCALSVRSNPHHSYDHRCTLFTNYPVHITHYVHRPINCPMDKPEKPARFRHFRILQTGHNSSNHNFLVLSGIEIYGELYF
jgi:hypothetical protein